jgi:hypothetical protein
MFRILALLLSLTVAAPGARTQDYLSKPLHLI